MKIFKFVFCVIVLGATMNAYSVVEHTGKIEAVQMWGDIAKFNLCNDQNQCKWFWIKVEPGYTQGLLSILLMSKASDKSVYIQGYDPNSDAHPYSGASKVYGISAS